MGASFFIVWQLKKIGDYLPVFKESFLISLFCLHSPSHPVSIGMLVPPYEDTKSVPGLL